MRDYPGTPTNNEKAALYPDAAKRGMGQMSESFHQMVGEIYVYKAAAAKEAIKAL